MRVGGKRQNQAVDFACSNADGQTITLGVTGQIHDARADVAMEIAVQWLVDACRWELVGTHLADHGKDGREGVLGPWIEGDMEDLRVVDDGVNGPQVIGGCCKVVSSFCLHEWNK